MRKRFTLGMAVVAVALCTSGFVRAAVFNYAVTLNAASESPSLTPAQSIGSGTGSIVYDNTAHTLALNVTWQDLSGTTTISHIHAPTLTSGLGDSAAASAAGNAGVATTTPTFQGFPAGVTFGSYSNVLDLTLASSWNAAYVTANGGTTAGAEAALAAALAEGKAYWNIHSSLFGGGEIRGFATLIPEPATIGLAGAALIGMGMRRRRN